VRRLLDAYHGCEYDVWDVAHDDHRRRETPNDNVLRTFVVISGAIDVHILEEDGGDEAEDAIMCSERLVAAR